MTRNPDDIDMRLIADWLKGANKPPFERLAEVLGVILDYHEQYGEGDEAPVHVSLLELLGEYFAGKAAWPKMRARERTKKAGAKHTKWKEQAKDIRTRRPYLSDSAVARHIVERIPVHERPKERTVRKAIRK
jgi:hypothetical protein